MSSHPVQSFQSYNRRSRGWNMAKKTEKCQRSPCQHEAKYIGTMFQYTFTKGGGRPKKKMIHEPMCKKHYLENTFGLWPYRCTKACQKQAQALSNKTKMPVVVKHDDLVVWVQLEAVIALRLKPKCPWCGKTMRLGTVEAQPAAKAKSKRRKP